MTKLVLLLVVHAVSVLAVVHRPARAEPLHHVGRHESPPDQHERRLQPDDDRDRASSASRTCTSSARSGIASSEPARSRSDSASEGAPVHIGFIRHDAEFRDALLKAIDARQHELRERTAQGGSEPGRCSTPLGPRRATLPLYAGGFLGPFGGAMLVALIPNVADGSRHVASASSPLRSPPTWCRSRRSSSSPGRSASGSAAAASFDRATSSSAPPRSLCAAAPEIWTFIGAPRAHGRGERLPQPDPPGRARPRQCRSAVLGRSVGTFAAVQVAGLTPRARCSAARSARCPGVSPSRSSRSCRSRSPSPGSARHRERGAARADASDRSLNRWIGLVSADGAWPAISASPRSASSSPSCVEQEFGLGSAASGLVVAAYGVGGIVLGRYAGRVADRIGRPWTALARRARLRGRRCSGWRSRPTRLGARARLLRGRLRLRVRVGRPEHDRRRVVPGEPGRRGIRLQRVQVRAASPIAPLVYVPLLDVDTRAAVPRGDRLLAARRPSSSCPGSGRYRRSHDAKAGSA